MTTTIIGTPEVLAQPNGQAAALMVEGTDGLPQGVASVVGGGLEGSDGVPEQPPVHADDARRIDDYDHEIACLRNRLIHLEGLRARALSGPQGQESIGPPSVSDAVPEPSCELLSHKKRGFWDRVFGRNYPELPASVAVEISTLRAAAEVAGARRDHYSGVVFHLGSLITYSQLRLAAIAKTYGPDAVGNVVAKKSPVDEAAALALYIDMVQKQFGVNVPTVGPAGEPLTPSQRATLIEALLSQIPTQIVTGTFKYKAVPAGTKYPL